MRSPAAAGDEDDPDRAGGVWHSRPRPRPRPHPLAAAKDSAN